MEDLDNQINKQNEISKFVLTQNPQALNVIDKLISELVDITNINQELLNILYNENTSDIDKFDGIINKLKYTSVEVIKKYGILINTDILIDIKLNWFFNFIHTIKQFNSLNSVEYLLISDELTEFDNDPSDTNIVDTTYNIFKLINPYMKQELFITNVDKVYIDFLNTFRDYVNNVLNSLDGTFEDDSDIEISKEVITITNLFTNLKGETIPDIISDLINDPMVLDMLIINGDNQYLSDTVSKLKTDYTIYNLFDYFIIRLLNGIVFNDIINELINIIDNKQMLDECVLVLKDQNRCNIISGINKHYLEDK